MAALLPRPTVKEFLQYATNSSALLDVLDDVCLKFGNVSQLQLAYVASTNTNIKEVTTSYRKLFSIKLI